jgi:hypothetical protein
VQPADVTSTAILMTRRQHWMTRAAPLALLMIAGSLLAPRAFAQKPAADGPRAFPGCAAAMCEDGAALVAALDTLLRMTPSCGERPPAVLRTLHLAPYTEHGDVIRRKDPDPHGLPSSPAVGRIEDVVHSSLRNYWPAIRIVDASDVRRGVLAADVCLFVFSPVTWMGEDRVRIIVSEVREQPVHGAQRFVFPRRERNAWRVTRVETGMQS